MAVTIELPDDLADELVRRFPGDADFGRASVSSRVQEVARLIEAARYVPAMGDDVTVYDGDGDTWTGYRVLAVTDALVIAALWGDLDERDYGKGEAVTWRRDVCRFVKVG
jgi:hypothetical protein